MHKNVGTTDALIRITGGLLGLAYGIGKMSRRPYNAPWLLMTFSAMKVAEGVTRNCLMYRALGINTRSEKGMQNIMDQAKSKGVQMVMKQVARTMNARKDESTQASSSPQQHSATSARQESSSHSRGHRLSAEDEQLEKAAREFVSFRSEDKESKNTTSQVKSQSESYSQEEHRYPTYS
ncbi:DUF2892 domain-containing protein [Brevibacillus choshinensis]|uniref:YgaP family membrane protein n=1 Tax=Brevibacillus choshinensis TaxID=54911 RepID=UPI002E1F7174|nr:DUF2892 domain-containing protein [Brevibacillus choshinensis]MED4752431.1 DUF2892 domain-containing protein [Brevibacillus choshinensis]MED4785084.1 DUF2892 domain-containing protein [Brevibacillus choshinensis]